MAAVDGNALLILMLRALNEKGEDKHKLAKARRRSESQQQQQVVRVVVVVN